MSIQIALIFLSVVMFSVSGFIEGRNRKTGTAFWLFILGCILLLVGLYYERIARFVQSALS